jgi:hypothetical protein
METGEWTREKQLVQESITNKYTLTPLSPAFAMDPSNRKHPKTKLSVVQRILILQPKLCIIHDYAPKHAQCP